MIIKFSVKSSSSSIESDHYFQVFQKLGTFKCMINGLIIIYKSVDGNGYKLENFDVFEQLQNGRVVVSNTFLSELRKLVNWGKNITFKKIFIFS